MKNKNKDCPHSNTGSFSRRKFFRFAAAGGLGAAIFPSSLLSEAGVKCLYYPVYGKPGKIFLLFEDM